MSAADDLRAAVSGDARRLELGWNLSGAGTARWGWWLVCPTGSCTWLGSSAGEALRRIEVAS